MLTTTIWWWIAKGKSHQQPLQRLSSYLGRFQWPWIVIALSSCVPWCSLCDSWTKQRWSGVGWASGLRPPYQDVVACRHTRRCKLKNGKRWLSSNPQIIKGTNSACPLFFGCSLRRHRPLTSSTFVCWIGTNKVLLQLCHKQTNARSPLIPLWELYSLPEELGVIVPDKPLSWRSATDAWRKEFSCRYDTENSMLWWIQSYFTE